MKKPLILLASLLAAALAHAEKPEWAGTGKPTAEQKALHQAAMEAKATNEADVQKK